MRAGAPSLRLRLLLTAVAAGLVFALLFGVLAAWRIQHAEAQAITATLQSRVELARDEVTADGSLAQDAGSPKTDLVQVLGPDGRVVASSPALAGAPPLVDVRTLHGQQVQGRVTLRRPDSDLATLGVPFRLRTGTGVLVVAADTEGFSTATSDLMGLLLVGLALLVLVVGALAWWLIGRALRSVTRLTESAESVRAGDLPAGLPVPEGDAELTRLVEALNRMLDRLHRTHAAEVAFAAEAGHRLRTPIATLRAEAELALRESDPVELGAALGRVVHDADQLTSVVDRMLARSSPRRGDTVERVIGVVGDASPRWHRLAALHDVSLQVVVDDTVDEETGCSDLLTVVEPLIDNAVRHTPSYGTITVELLTEDRDVVITVSNEGEPPSKELTPYVFDAWVSTRDASTAGGLGLWVSRQTARDAGGDVELLDTVSGATFQVRLPRSRAGSVR